MDGLKSLDSGFLVNANKMLALGMRFGSGSVQLAYLVYSCAESCFVVDFRIHPRRDSIGAQINVLENSPDGALRDSRGNLLTLDSTSQLATGASFNGQSELSWLLQRKRNNSASLLASKTQSRNNLSRSLATGSSGACWSISAIGSAREHQRPIVRRVRPKFSAAWRLLKKHAS